MIPPTLDELLARDLTERTNRIALADTLAAAGRYAEAHLCRNLGVPVRVVEGRIVEC